MANKFTGTERVYYPKCYAEVVLYVENYDASSTNAVHFIVEPKDFDLERNSYNQADTFSISFDGKEMPIHPGRIRTGNVSVWLFDSRGTDRLGPESIRGRTATIEGVIDEVDYTDGSNGSELTFQCQDFTALFIERRYRDSKDRKKSKGKKTGRIYRNRVVNSKSLGTALINLIKEAGVGKVGFENRTGIDNKKLPKVGSGSTRTSKKRGFPVKDEATYWDVMTQMAGRHGFILFVENSKVVLGNPLKVIKDVKIPEYFMIWGNNLSKLDISRKMGKERTPRVRVVSYDPKLKKVVSATYPKNKKQIATSGVGTLYDEIDVKRVNGVVGHGNLLRLAENYYNLKARGEAVTTIETNDMLDINGNDLLKVSAGHLMHVKIDPLHKDRPGSSTSAQNKAKLASAFNFARLPVPVEAINELAPDVKEKSMYVRKGSIRYSIDNGVDISFELIQLVDDNKAGSLTGSEKKNKKARKQEE